MPLSAWITFVVVSLVIYGGFALCLRIAIRRPPDKGGEESE